MVHKAANAVKGMAFANFLLVDFNMDGKLAAASSAQ
jgi:hypothetical protein